MSPRDQKAYLAAYYRKNRARIRAQQRQSYEAKYEDASPELLKHLRENPVHARGWRRIGKVLQRIVCAECERLGLKPVVCLECGRVSLKQLAAHTNAAHKIVIAVYNRKWGYNVGASMTVLAFHKVRSQLSRSPKNIRRLRPLRFTPETARHVNTGRRRKLRPQAIEARKVLRGTPRLTHWKAKVSWWTVASLRLGGKGQHDIAEELKVSQGAVSKKCRMMGLGDEARYWRGEVVSYRHLLNLMRDFRLSEVEVASRMEQPMDRIRRAVARKYLAFEPDLANAVLELNKKLRKETLSVSPTREGGRPHKLMPSEVDEIPWKYRVLVNEFRNLHQVLPSSRGLVVPEKAGESLCRLARQGKLKLLLLWAHEFLRWLRENHDLNAESLSDPQAAARDFIATQYGISEATVERLLPKRVGIRANQVSVRARTLLLDVKTAIGDQAGISTSQLLSTLSALRPRWKKLHARSLAAMLKPFELQPRNLRLDGTVVKGYRRRDVRAYSTQGVASEIGRAVQTLKKWMSQKKIPVPPLVASAGTRRGNRTRLWTQGDIDVVKASIAAQPPQAFRQPRSATPQRRLHAV